MSLQGFVLVTLFFPMSLGCPLFSSTLYYTCPGNSGEIHEAFQGLIIECIDNEMSLEDDKTTPELYPTVS